jgi:hypothetical protein
MKKLLLLAGIVLLLASCMPMRISQHEKNHWHKKKVRAYFYRTRPFYQQRRIRGKVYTPYFRPGKF